MENKKLTGKNVFNRMGIALLTVCALSIALQLIVVGLVSNNNTLFSENSYFKWIATFTPIYASFIIGILIMKKLPKDECCGAKLGTKNFLVLMLCCFPVMYGGNIIGNMLSGILSGGDAENGILTYALDNSLLKILFMVILAPLLEEFLFRKQIIDRCVRYGEKIVILFSAITFALFHMNLFQFFYAFGLGLIFAYTYTRTRKLHYSVIMHMVVNFIGSVIAPAVVSSLGLETIDKLSTGVINEAEIISILPQLIGFLLYTFTLLGLSIAGLVVLIVTARKLVFFPKEEEIEKGKRFKTVYCNVGMILFALLCIIVCILTLIM